MRATERDLDESLRAEGIHPNALPTARKVCDALRPLVESAREADMLGRDIEAFFACCVRAMVWHRTQDANAGH